MRWERGGGRGRIDGSDAGVAGKPGAVACRQNFAKDGREGPQLGPTDIRQTQMEKDAALEFVDARTGLSADRKCFRPGSRRHFSAGQVALVDDPQAGRAGQ